MRATRTIGALLGALAVVATGSLALTTLGAGDTARAATVFNMVVENEVTPTTPRFNASSFCSDVNRGSDLIVGVGDTVVWRNCDPNFAHTITFAGDAYPEKRLDAQTRSVSQLFDRVGSFSYACRFHTSETGTVIVRETTPGSTTTTRAGQGTTTTRAATTTSQPGATTTTTRPATTTTSRPATTTTSTTSATTTSTSTTAPGAATSTSQASVTLVPVTTSTTLDGLDGAAAASDDDDSNVPAAILLTAAALAVLGTIAFLAYRLRTTARGGDPAP